MDRSKDDDAYPNDVPLELEASQSDMDDLARIQSEHQNQLLLQLHQARESRRLRAENLEHEAKQQDTAPQSPDDITDGEQIRIDDERDIHFVSEAEEEEEESEMLQAESSENEPEQQDIATQNAAEITDEGRYRMYSEEEKRLSEVVKKYKQNRRRRVKAPEPRPEQQEVTPDAPQSPNEVTSRIDGDAAWDELISTDSTDLPVVRGPKLARFRPLADPLDIKFEEPLHEGRFSHIWKVSCRGYVYALKIVSMAVVVECHMYPESRGDTC